MTVNPQGDLKNHIRFIAEYEDGSSDVFAVPECTCAEPHPSSAPCSVPVASFTTKLPGMRRIDKKHGRAQIYINEMQSSSLIKVAAVAAILALGGLGFAHDALACGRFDGGHFGHGGRFTGNFHDHGRRVFSRSPSYGDEDSGRTGCRCTELSCCDGD